MPAPIHRRRTALGAAAAAVLASVALALSGCSSSTPSISVDVGGSAAHASDDTTVHGQLNKITVRGGAGSVEITAGPSGTSATTVHRDIEYHGDKPAAVPGSTSGGSLTLGSGCDCSIDYRITTPPGPAVTVDSAAGPVSVTGADTVQVRGGAGTVRVNRAAGAVTVNVGSGDVDLDGIGGPLIVTALSGTITGRDVSSATADLASGAGSQQVVFSSAPHRISATAAAGGIRLTLPRHAYRVDAHTVTGSVTSGLPNDSAAADTLTVHTVTGNIALGTF
ncbi:DUF4097 family beta strand repeat-containing protein [Phaeacidiphilus oryzae]|uniref:DUF4097 family beta strand repeat-containing protein n=1 Tax=Phaeacidiphilus oryzae TaxID=348818 RepID=UPI00055F2775|nr:DUF4097 family beta strand repeat-containing protein [Phaeacidiphilus oryzae]